MKKLLSVLLVLAMLASPVLAFADDVESKADILGESVSSAVKGNKSTIENEAYEGEQALDYSLSLSGTGDKTTDDPDVRERGIAAVKATSCSDLVVLPQDGSWLEEWRTGYARKAFKAPCLQVQRISKLHTGRDVMPWLYEGTEATVLAEENDMALIIYRGSDDKFYAGWIQAIRILDDFPGKKLTIGTEPEGDLNYRDDIGLDWSRCSWLTTQQNYTVLSEEVKDCVGFTLDYQIIAENTNVWENILGPRKVYVKSHGEWIEVGEFPYPEFGTVKVQVWLDEPMDIDAVGTIAQCRLPNTFWFRQVVTDFAVPETAA